MANVRVFGLARDLNLSSQEVIDRLALKHKASANFIPAPVVRLREGAQIGVVTIGSCDSAVR